MLPWLSASTHRCSNALFSSDTGVLLASSLSREQ
jgi:hypothetical protein